jgi:small subunit ribosomal protein S6
LETMVKKLYEAMFLVDSAQAAADWDGIIARIKNILARADAEVLSLRKWDERRLAYEIKGKARGTYILCYFRADGQRIQGIEQDVRLSEHLMRVLILSAEHMTAEDVEKDTHAMRVESDRQRPAQAAVPKTEPTRRAKAERAQPPGEDEPSQAELSDEEEVNHAAQQEKALEPTTEAVESEAAGSSDSENGEGSAERQENEGE